MDIRILHFYVKLDDAIVSYILPCYLQRLQSLHIYTIKITGLSHLKHKWSYYKPIELELEIRSIFTNLYLWHNDYFDVYFGFNAPKLFTFYLSWFFYFHSNVLLH